MKYLIFCIALCSYHIYGAAEGSIHTGKPREFSGLRLMRWERTFMPIVHGFTALDGDSSFSTKEVLVEQEVADTSNSKSNLGFTPTKLERTFCHIMLQGATKQKRNEMFGALKIAVTNFDLRARELARHRHTTTEDIELAKMDAQEFPTFYTKPEVAAFKNVFEQNLADHEVTGPLFDQLADMCIGFLHMEPRDGCYHHISYEAVEGKQELFGLKPSFTYTDTYSTRTLGARIVMFNKAGRELMTHLYDNEPNIQIMLARNLHDDLIASLKEHAAKRNIKLCGVLVVPHNKPKHD